MFKFKAHPYKETKAEEIVNSLINGIGLILAIIGLVYLISAAGEHPDKIAPFAGAVYGISTIVLYLSALLYHAIPHEKTKGIFKVLDHCAIYVLIAGSYTPFALLALQGTIGWAIFAIIWSLALIGMIFKLFYTNSFEKTSTLLYVLMGWGGVIMIKPLYLILPFDVFVLLVAGGITYTLGIIFFAWERLHFSHAIWHIFVFAGSLLHFLSILLLFCR